MFTPNNLHFSLYKLELIGVFISLTCKRYEMTDKKQYLSCSVWWCRKYVYIVILVTCLF